MFHAKEETEIPAHRPPVVVDAEKYAEVEASYSGDTISKGTIRKPFAYAGGLYVTVGSVSGGDRVPQSRVYGLCGRQDFQGAVRAYEVSEAHRNDPNGFYHGIAVTHGKDEWVMVGPEFTFTTAVIPAQPPAPAEAPEPPDTAGEFIYYLADGRGPFDDCQAAMDALGIAQDKRPKHNRWHRFSKDLRDKIRRVPVSV